MVANRSVTLPLNAEGVRLLVAILLFAKAKGYPWGPFEKQLLERLSPTKSSPNPAEIMGAHGG